MAIDFNILMQASGQHPARTMSFDALYTGLMQEVALGNVSVTKNDTGELELFSYTVDCQFGQKWNIFSLISRGLILCPSKRLVVATPFVKFLNFSEGGYFLPKENFTANVKIDGSLGIIFFWNGDWQVATRGSFQSEQAQWAKIWLDKNVNKGHFIEGDTYLAEIIYSENRIVIPYDFEGLVMLSAYDRLGYEFSYGEMADLADSCGMRHTEQKYFSSIDEIVNLCDTLPYTEEGFVIRFESGYRVKIKSTDYCRIHKLISNVRPIYIWESLVNGDDMDAVRKQLPEELRKDYDAIRKILENTFAEYMKELIEGYENTKSLSDKELGLHILECRQAGYIGSDIKNEFVANNLFLCRKKDLFNTVCEKGSECRKRIFKYFYPKGDRLKDFVPTNAMNRFAEEEA